MNSARLRSVLFDWGGTLMSEDGPLDIPMALWPEVRPIDGAKEMLQALAKDYRLGVATNATVSRRPMIEHALARVGLMEHITDIFCFTELGVRKDSAEFWSHVLATLRMEASEVAMVGDTLEQDVIPPTRFGIYSIWFDEGGRRSTVPGLPTVTSLAGIAPLLRDRVSPAGTRPAPR
jgi:FMN phosphatase YigB (HAD superfamily)